MSFTNTSYNFLPYFDQWSSGQNNTNGFDGPGNVNLLDPFLANYQITTGDIIPLQTDNNGVPINIQGVAGPTGSTGGTTGDPPAATVFMMVSYAQVLNGAAEVGAPNVGGIVQFSLYDPSYGYNGAASVNYYFISQNDEINYNYITLLYYTVDNSTAPAKIMFYDAKIINSNPTAPIYSSHLFSYTYGPYSGNSNTFATWPSINNAEETLNDYSNYKGDEYEYEAHQMTTTFQFYEMTTEGTNNPLDSYLKSGKMYHPYYIQMLYTDGTSNDNGYTNYSSNSSYVQGYSPGYPININYAYTPISNNSVPIIKNGNNISPNRYNSFYPGTVNNSLYSFNANNTSVADNDYTNAMANIDNFNDNPFLPCNCKDNNDCSSSFNYFSTNCNTIQAGIAQYLVYQFLPIKQIKPTSTNIIPNFENTEYSYNTLPINTEFTPSKLGISGPTGSYPLQIQELIDGNTGNTGIAAPSIISNWMKTPNNINYICSGAVDNNSYCGFTNYYDSLLGIAYEYGTCGSTGISSNPFQKGSCSSDDSTICVPNFSYLNPNFSPYIDPVFFCVNKDVGITTQNLNNYSQNIPVNNNQNQFPVSYPQYDPVSLSNQNPNFGNKSTSGTKYIYLIIALVLIVVVIAIVIYIFIKLNKNKPSMNFRSL